MRTAIVGLTRVHDREATADAAQAVALLTHADPLGIESCVLWSEAVRHAVIDDELDLAAGLDLLPVSRRDEWAAWIDEATDVDPRTFGRNGFTVWALQAAWAAITSPPQEIPAEHFAEALKNAVRAGDDTDTVAAIAGGLLGARWGQSAIPLDWTRRVHGYGDHRARGLVTLAHLTATEGHVHGDGWPTGRHIATTAYTEAPTTLVTHPHDAGVKLGTVTSPPHGCDAVVSLCRMGVDDVAADGVEVRLIDSEDLAQNPHLNHVLLDSARLVKTLRDEGKTVFVHCVAAQARTPAVAVTYSRLLGVPLVQAQDDVLGVLPDARGSGALWEAAARLI